MKKQKSNRKPMQTAPSAWIPRKEAMSMLQCGKVKYHELLKYGQIKGFTFANRAFVERESVERYIATHDLKYNKDRKSYMTEKEDSDGQQRIADVR